MSSTKNNDSLFARIRKYLRANQVLGFDENQIIEKTAHALGLSFEEASFAFGVLKTCGQIVSERIALSESQQKVAEGTIHFVVACARLDKPFAEKPNKNREMCIKNSKKLKSRSHKRSNAHSRAPSANNPLPRRLNQSYNGPNFLKDYAARRPKSEIDYY